jgi:very-short-patch-repair endonuclease
MLEDNRKLRQFAKQMRREATTAEKTAWRVLRNRRLTGFKFRRQHPFGKYILDCYCPSAKVVVELDGDSHATPEGQVADAERTRYLEVRGILVLRFWNSEIAENQDAIADTIAEVCAARVKTRHMAYPRPKTP